MTASKTAATAKHASAGKHAGTAKHALSAKQKAALAGGRAKAAANRKGKKVTVKAKTAAHATAAKALARPGEWLPVCSFEAVAQSLRLAGARVHEDEVGELWHLLGEPADGVSAGDALAVAALFGLAGCRPAVIEALDHPSLPFGQGLHVEDVDLGEVDHDLSDGLLHGLILGVDVPGPHAVLATPDGWWSWGKLYSPWPCRVDEAWAVTW